MAGYSSLSVVLYVIILCSGARFFMKRRLPFRYILPAFFGGLLDDPLLLLRIRPLKRALLFDCGQIAHLAKRAVKPIDAVFITHAHMDHIMGIPTLVRHHHASPR